MKISDLIKKVGSTNSTNGKIKLLKDNEGNNTLRRIFFLAYSNSIVFGIKKIPEVEGEGNNSFDEALDFLEFKLAGSGLSGHAAIDAFKKTLEGLPKDEQKLLANIVSKDLEIGASSSTANKVWPNLIKKQPQMLASSNSEKTLANIKYPCYSQLKADGARCFIEIRPNGTVVMVSRSGKSYKNLKRIEKQVLERYKKLEHLYPNGVMIDGELVYYKSSKKQISNPLEAMFGDDDDQEDIVVEKTQESRTMSNGIANKSLSGTISDEEADNMHFECWDLVDLKETHDPDALSQKKKYSVRLEELTVFIEGLSSMVLIETITVNNIDEAREIYNVYVSKGYEGSILKNIDSLWENKRSKNLVKFKEVYTIDLEIVDYYIHKKDPFKIGGFTLKSSDGIILVDCGSGLTDTDKRKIGTDDEGNSIFEDIPLEERSETNRAYLYSIRETLKERIVECECNGYLFNKDWKDGDTITIFLGTFQRFRDDKSEANSFEDVFGLSFNEAKIKNGF